MSADRHWITGPGDGSLVASNYGTATLPLNWFDASKWFESDNSTSALVPVDGQSVLHANSCCNPEPFVSIDNAGAGAGVNLPNSTLEFTAKTSLLDFSAGNLSDVEGGSYNFAAVDDVLVADSIGFNGEGGSGVDVYVPVVANTLTSNRHGARIYAPITVERIIATSGHQDKWEINASPTNAISLLELNENRGADGDSIDGFFEINADTEITTVDHIWQRLRIGMGATLYVDTFNYRDHTSKASNNNINPIELQGAMTVGSFNVVDVDSSKVSMLAKGTYGRIGHGMVDNEVDWIVAGDGVLTVLDNGAGCYAITAENQNVISICL